MLKKPQGWAAGCTVCTVLHRRPQYVNCCVAAPGRRHRLTVPVETCQISQSDKTAVDNSCVLLPGLALEKVWQACCVSSSDSQNHYSCNFPLVCKAWLHVSSMRSSSTCLPLDFFPQRTFFGWVVTSHWHKFRPAVRMILRGWKRMICMLGWLLCIHLVCVSGVTST